MLRAAGGNGGDESARSVPPQEAQRPDTVESVAVSHRAAQPADERDRFLEVLEPLLARYRDSAERRLSLALLRAVRLAPDLETCEEILRTGRVPRRRLDPEWARWYGL